MQQLPGFSKVDAVSKLVTSLAAVAVFSGATSGLVKALVLVNLSLGLIVPQSKLTASLADHMISDADVNKEDTRHLLMDVNAS